MKRNGFTLVELIATIVLMTMLATVILINMVGVKDEQDQKSVTKFMQHVEDAACTYIDGQNQIDYRESCKKNSNGCNISLKVLIGEEVPNSDSLTTEEIEKRRASLIDPEYLDKETNLTAEEEKDTVYVTVKWIEDNGNKKKVCEFHRK